MHASALLLAALSGAALGSPLLAGRAICNAAPSGPSSGAVSPIKTLSTAATAAACQALCNAEPACQSFVFGQPAGAAAPECMLFAVPADQVPSQGSNLAVFDKSCSAAAVPSNPPSAGHPIGTRADTCGKAPAGAATSNPTPLKTDASVKTAQECLSLCKATAGCKSIEFGATTAGGAQQCMLYSVAASELPAPATGASLVAYDVGC